MGRITNFYTEVLAAAILVQTSVGSGWKYFFVAVSPLKVHWTDADVCVYLIHTRGSVLTRSRLTMIHLCVSLPEIFQLFGDGEDLSGLLIRADLLKTLSLQIAQLQLLQEGVCPSDTMR